MFSKFLHRFAIKLSFMFSVYQSLCVNIYKVSKDNATRLHPEVEGKVIKGEPIGIERLPSAAQFFNFGNLCSGTIINSWSVLTAAHCFDDNKEVSDMVIQLGARFTYDYDGKRLEVSEFVIHRNYDKARSFACDIAIIFVNKPIEFGTKVKKALLINNRNWMNGRGDKFLVAGWGWTEYGGPISKLGLMMTHLQYVPKEECERLHNVKFTADMFCLYGGGVRDTCKGDSGAGVLWKGMVVGIVSHGDGCSRKNKPSIYTNVWYFRKWIKTQIRRFIKRSCRKEKIASNKTFSIII